MVVSCRLTNDSQDLTYSFAGSLTNCQSTESGAPASGSVEANKVVTDPATGEQFQEPAATGNGSCATSRTSGIAIVTWADGTQTVVQYSTTGVAAAVELSGTVIDSVTIPAITRRRVSRRRRRSRRRAMRAATPLGC